MKIQDQKHILASSLIALMVGSALFTPQAFANNNLGATQLQTSVMQSPLEKTPRKRLTVVTGMEYSQKIAVEEKGQRESGTDLLLELSYRTSDLTTVTAKAVATKEISGQQETTLANTQVILGIKGIALTSNLSTAHSVSGVIPTNELSQKRDRLQMALGISNGLNYIHPLVTVSYRLGLSKNVHQFNMNAEGQPNIEYTLTNSLAADIPVMGAWHVSLGSAYKEARTYNNFSRTSFSFDADLNYDLTQMLTANLGTSNGGNALKANGVDSNIAVYDDNSSVLRAGIAYTF